MRNVCLAVVPPDRVLRLQQLDPEKYTWVVASTWADAVRTIQTAPIDVGVVDPILHGASSIVEVEQLHAQFPSLPLILYTALSPAAAGVLLRLGRVGIRCVVFARFEDAPGNLRRMIARELEHSAAQDVVQALDGELRALPARLRVALGALLHTPGERVGLSALAAQARLTPAECKACFARTSLPAPRVVMVLTRILYAHRLLLDPGYTIEDVARKLGYAKSRTLQAQLREVFGMTAGELRSSLTIEDAVRIVADRYFAPESREASPAPLISLSG